MQKINTLLLLAVLASSCYAHEMEEQGAKLTLGYENFDFKNSKMKDKGQRFTTALEYKHEDARYQMLYDRTNTDTYQPPLTKDLKIDKFFFKYTRMLDETQSIHASYGNIQDNIMEETDDGNIYGLGYKYKAFDMTQYISDYHRFNVYQTDMQYTFKKEYMGAMLSATLVGKYIHLQNKESNPISAKADTDYFTPGIKLHAHHHGYHVGAGAFFGKRIFAVMNDGFAVQHHAMEFDRTYAVGISKDLDPFNVKVIYSYLRATEVPIANENVQVNNIALQLSYTF